MGYHIDKTGTLYRRQQQQQRQQQQGEKPGKHKASSGSHSTSSTGSTGSTGSGSKRIAVEFEDSSNGGKKQRGSKGKPADGVESGSMFEKERRFHARSKAEARQMQAEKDAEINERIARKKEQQAKRLVKSRNLSRKNKRGQINMAAHIQHILDKLETRG